MSKKQLDKIKADGEAKKQQMQVQQQSAAAEPPRMSGAPNGMPMRETPQVVVDRMLGRIFMFTGVPVGLGLALLPLFYYLKVSKQACWQARLQQSQPACAASATQQGSLFIRPCLIASSLRHLRTRGVQCRPQGYTTQPSVIISYP